MRQLAVTHATENFWQRFLATYRFRRRFGRESWWASFRVAIRAAWAMDLIKVEKVAARNRRRAEPVPAVCLREKCPAWTG